MNLYPEAKVIELVTLQHSGIVTKKVNLENLVPATWEDYLNSTRRKLFEFPNFIDNEMVYYNTVWDEYFIFDKEAEWNE